MIEQWSLYLKYKVKAHLLAGPQRRPEGGIEPLRLSSAMGLKPALRPPKVVEAQKEGSR